jgi:biopolymer transport protein ExbD
MARSRWNESESFEVPLTPLVDIIFNLIIFFLVATTFYSEERDLHIRLPEGTEGVLVTREDRLYVINVRDSGVFVVGSRVMTLQDLEQELRAMVREGRPRVEIRGDTNARHGVIMSVMNLCRACGIADYALTQRIVKDAG